MSSSKAIHKTSKATAVASPALAPIRGTLDVRGVCIFCSISRPTLYRCIQRGEIPGPSFKLGRRPMWLLSALEKWATARAQEHEAVSA